MWERDEAPHSSASPVEDWRRASNTAHNKKTTTRKITARKSTAKGKGACPPNSHNASEDAERIQVDVKDEGKDGYLLSSTPSLVTLSTEPR